MDTFENTVELLLDQKMDIDEVCSLLEFWADSYSGDTERYEKAKEFLEELYINQKISDDNQRKILRSISACAGVHAPLHEEEDDDATVIAPPLKKSPENEDIAIEVEDEDATVFANPDLGDITIQLDGTETAPSSPSDEDHDDGKLKPGSILKDRFNLVSVLGEGGMGTVYKAIDMLKVEAKDMNPYVAIKVLTDEFKEHPDAFIALQRETSKAQKLAHPNIATVYDFDRDKETVYMTMELLEGKPLDDFIKSMPEGGLSEEEALEIITGLGEGLAYAHANGLVHSDFKPGNAFILYDGPVKVIDFGIARAAGGAAQDPAPDHDISKTGLETNLNPAPTDNTGTPTTDFDAGTLGALTPAYATVEMFEGKEPAPSDDIYALACVAVQLLTGKHPFKKRTAPKAKELGMKPPVIEGFTKRQQRALEKALEFTRDKRTETMEEFLDGIRRRKNYTKQIVLGTIVTLSLIGGFGYKPITNYYEQQEIEKIIIQANEGTSVRLLQTLSTLNQYTEEKRNAIKNGIKDKALEIYTTKIQEAVNIENQQYEFDEANKYINEALSYYSDSAAIKELSVQVAAARETLIQDLHTKYVEYLTEHQKNVQKNITDQILLADDTQEDLTDILKLLRKIAPEDEIFNDPRLEISYYNAAEDALNKKEFRTAEEYLTTGSQFVAESRIYDELSDKIAIAKLSNQITNAQAQAASNMPDDFVGTDDLVPYIKDLTILSYNTVNTAPIYAKFIQLFNTEFNQLNKLDQEHADTLLQQFSVALPLNKLLAYTEQLASLEIDGDLELETAGKSATHFIDSNIDIEKFISQVSEIRSNIGKYKIKARTDYNIDFESNIRSLSEKNRVSLIDYYNKFYDALLISDTKTSAESYLAESTKALNVELTRVKIQANIENEKRIFRNIAAENRLQDSVKTYNKIVNNTDDEEFLDFARKEISRMYSNLAETNANEENYVSAHENAVNATKYFSNEYIEKQVRQYKKEIGTQEVVRLILTREQEDAATARKLLTTLRAEYADDYPFIVDKIGYLVNIEIIPLAEINILDAHKLKEHALSVVKSDTIQRVRIKGLPAPSKLAIQGKIEVGQKNLTAAISSMNKAAIEHPGHYMIDELKEMLDYQLGVAKNIYKQYENYFNEEKYAQADKALNNAIAEWKDNPKYNAERLYYDRVMVQVKAKAKLCRTDLQGIGKQTRGACNDVILSTGKEAPTMVVVPAISKKSNPYAIGKYEISISQLNHYCEATNKCSKLLAADTELPATNVPTEIMEDYARWLTKETGFAYQIASHEQWSNASASGGREGNSNYNCRLRLGTKLIKGQNIVPVKSGSVNNWGLINYVGNVDEIVKTDNGYLLAGGNFSDSISDCKVSLKKPFNGNSNTTGFRLARGLE